MRYFVLTMAMVLFLNPFLVQAEDAVQLTVSIKDAETLKKKHGVVPQFAVWARRGPKPDSLVKTPAADPLQVQATYQFGTEFQPQVQIVNVPCVVKLESNLKEWMLGGISSLYTRYPTLILASDKSESISIKRSENTPIFLFAERSRERQMSLLIALDHQVHALTDKNGQASMKLPCQGEWKMGLATAPSSQMNHIRISLDGEKMQLQGFTVQPNFSHPEPKLEIQVLDSFFEE